MWESSKMYNCTLMSYKWFDNEKLGKVMEPLGNQISDLGIEAINNNNISIGDIGRKGLHLNGKGTNKLIDELISQYIHQHTEHKQGSSIAELNTNRLLSHLDEISCSLKNKAG